MSFFAGRLDEWRQGGATTGIAPHHILLTRAPTMAIGTARSADTASDTVTCIAAAGGRFVQRDVQSIIFTSRSNNSLPEITVSGSGASGRTVTTASVRTV